MKNRSNIKNFLVGLGVGALSGGIGVFLMDSDNRKKIKNKVDEFSDSTTEFIEKIKEAIKEAEKEGKKKLAEELQKAQDSLEKAKKDLK